METKWLTVNVKSVDKDARTIEGMASVKSVDYEGEVILPSAWRSSLAMWKSVGSRPKFLAYHQHRLMDGHSPVLGKILKMKVEPEGLSFKAQFAETDLGEEHLELYHMGAMDAFSVGFVPQERERDPEKIAKILKRNNVKADDANPVTTVTTKAHILEVSAVVVGMNIGALVSQSAEGCELAVKALKRLEEMAKIMPHENRAAPLITSEAISVYGPAEELEQESEFDFEATKDVEPIDELGPEEEPTPTEGTETVEPDAPAEEPEAPEEKDTEEADMGAILRDLIDCLKGLGASVGEIQEQIKTIREEIAAASAPPAQPSADAKGGPKGRDAAVHTLRGLSKDVLKLRESFGLRK
jgi:HK97 family phage prohead protease